MEMLAQTLSRLTQAGQLYEPLPDLRVRCFACGHRCLIHDGHEGICRVRFNRGGALFVPHGYFGGIQCDPIEKKPFFHVLPGSATLSFGMLGCDLHCGYCQNWLTSQTLRDPASFAPTMPMSPTEFCRQAMQRGAASVTSTYNEPLITSEWAVTVFREARRHGLKTAFVSNGNGTEEVLDFLRPWVDFYKVDLKSFQDRNYRQLGGTLAAVVRTIEQLWRKGFWVEVVTLIVPGFNDRAEELRDIARFLAGVSPDLPWHCTAFHPDYKMLEYDRTTARKLVEACEIGREAGLRYCYAGNLPGQVGEWEDTRCPGCATRLVQRAGFRVLKSWLTEAGTCPRCGLAIAGRWR